jgi:hypothetical protein
MSEFHLKLVMLADGRTRPRPGMEDSTGWLSRYKELIISAVQQLAPHVQISTVSCKMWNRSTTSC